MEAKVFVSCNHPWIKCICPSCSKEFDDFTINYCQVCGINVTFNNFHQIYNHYDRCNLDVEWHEVLKWLIMARYTGEHWNELYYLRNDGKIYVVNNGEFKGRIYEL